MRFPPWGDLLTAYNGAAISYDEIGNPDGYSDRTFTWEHGRQLAAQTKGGVEWTYTYDANGMRTKRSSDSKTYEYVYSGDKLVQMTITDHTTSPETVQLMEFSYDAAGQPLTFTIDGVTYYYVLNIQGDVMGMVDGDGNLLYTMVYEGYGAGYYFSGGSAAATTLLGTNPLGYRGYVMDSGTGLYYLQSRYYDPEIGRFLNADAFASTGQGLIGNNMFAYCLNNPVNMVDHEGTDAILVIHYVLGQGGLIIVGHALLYIQDSNGDWYCVEFTGKKKSDAKVYVYPADTEEVEKMSQGKYVWGKEYVYLEGDSTEAYQAAKKYEGTNYDGYNFFTNNCADFEHEILEKVDFEGDVVELFLSMYDPLVPRDNVRYLWVAKLYNKIVTPAVNLTIQIKEALEFD